MAHRKDKYVDHVLVRYTPRQAIKQGFGRICRAFLHMVKPQARFQKCNWRLQGVFCILLRDDIGSASFLVPFAYDGITCGYH